MLQVEERITTMGKKISGLDDGHDIVGKLTYVEVEALISEVYFHEDY